MYLIRFHAGKRSIHIGTSLPARTLFHKTYIAWLAARCKLYTAFKAQAFAVIDNSFDTKNWLNMVDVFHIRVIRLDGNTDLFVYMFGDLFLL
jgi:hypothetical protein